MIRPLNSEWCQSLDDVIYHITHTLFSTILSLKVNSMAQLICNGIPVKFPLIKRIPPVDESKQPAFVIVCALAAIIVPINRQVSLAKVPVIFDDVPATLASAASVNNIVSFTLAVPAPVPQPTHLGSVTTPRSPSTNIGKPTLVKTVATANHALCKYVQSFQQSNPQPDQDQSYVHLGGLIRQTLLQGQA